MKGILMSIRPEWCKKIFNGEKTIEVRKTAPKLYDKPRELGEFVKPCDWNYDCCTCKRAVYELTKAEAKLFYGCDREITRPPQSWCYVDELQ